MKYENLRSSINYDLGSIENNITWELVKHSSKKVIDVRWVCKLNLRQNGEFSWHKERLVAKGFLQNEGINMSELYALVSRLETI